MRIRWVARVCEWESNKGARFHAHRSDRAGVLAPRVVAYIEGEPTSRVMQVRFARLKDAQAAAKNLQAKVPDVETAVALGPDRVYEIMTEALAW